MKNLMAIIIYLAHIACHAMINVSPVYIEFSNNKDAVEITLENHDNKERIFNASIKQWSQELGKDIYSDTNDLLVLPFIRRVMPNSQQKFRVILRKKTDGTLQKSFRLFFREVPQLPKNMSLRTSLSIAFQLVVPVFINEKNYVANQNIIWTANYDTHGKIVLKLENKGNTFLKLGQLRAKELSKPIDSTWRYILPNNEKTWEIKNLNSIDKKLSLSFVELVAQRPAEKSETVLLINPKKESVKNINYIKILTKPDRHYRPTTSVKWCIPQLDRIL